VEALALRPSLDFTLPSALEARRPPRPRDSVRLLVSHRHGALRHARFLDLPDVLSAGDLLVVNDSAAIPAALPARLPDGREVALHLSTWRGGDAWVVEPRPPRDGLRGPSDGLAVLAPGDVLGLPAGGAARLLSPYPDSTRLWNATLALPLPPRRYLRRHGRPIRYAYAQGDVTLSDYQTLFGRRPGSAEMPSAARPFTPRVAQQLAERQVRLAPITLHTGVSSLEGHECPYAEWFSVPPETAWMVAVTRRCGGRVIAVGTTVVRALESAWSSGAVRPTEGWTDLLITPARGVRAVDSLLTGFHESRATHLAMLEALTGPDVLSAAYAAALTNGYRWHEFGDLHLIL